MKYFLFSVLLLATRIGVAQVIPPTAFASPEQAAQHKAAFIRKVKAKHLLRDPAWYYRNQIDVTKDKALRKEGVQLSVLDMRAGSGNYKENVVYATTVVRGRIVERKDDARREVFYHSSYLVAVDEVLVGQAPASITVYRRSGPVGDVMLKASDETPLPVGEQFILYLNPINAQELAEAKARGEWNYENNAVPGAYMAPEQYRVVTDTVVDEDSRIIGQLTAVSANIRRIGTTLDKAHFYQKSFD